MLKNTYLGVEQERAVSPVVGVVLMVAATVILGGVVAAFVTGMGGSMSGAPQASFGFTYDETADSLTLAHEGGDSLDGDRISIKINDPDGTVSDTELNASELGITGQTLSTGYEETIASGELNGDETVRIVWSAANSDETTLIAKWQGPDA